MILSDLLGLPARDEHGRRLGWVVDARFSVVRTADGRLSEPKLESIVVSPHSRHSILGYERSDVNAPAILNDIMQWMHRGSRVVAWSAVALVSNDHVELRAGYDRRG